MRRRFNFTRPVAVAATLTLLATALFTAAAPTTALADPAADPTDISLTTAGASSTSTVPDGVCAADVRVIGGGGGANFANGTGTEQPNSTDRGGDSVEINASYQVHPGQPWSASVGGGGGGAANLVGGAGVNGAGGNGSIATSFHEGGGGGGRSDFYIGTLATPAIVAGGGGGSGGGHYKPGMDGGDAGVPAAAGVAAAGADGAGGSDADGTVFFPGGQGGQAGAAGTGSDNPNDAGATGGNGVNGNGGVGGTGSNPALDQGGGGGGGLWGGGGGAGTLNDGGSGLWDPIASPFEAYLSEGGGGGGGGSSIFAGTAVDGLGTVPTFTAAQVTADGPGRSGWGGTQDFAAAQGMTGLATVDFIPCSYDLSVAKSVSPAAVLLGETATWTVTITNIGPDEMTRGDIVTLTDSLPGSGATSVVSVTHTAGTFSGLDQNTVSCNLTDGGAMAATVTCSQDYSSASATGVPASGSRGLDVGGSIEIVYTQVAAEVGCITNVAGVTDRVDNGSDSAELCVSTGANTLEIDKSVSSGPTNNADGTYTLAYDIVVTNPTSSPGCDGLGTAPGFCVQADQTNVQITDGLDSTIAAAATSISSAVTAGTCTDPATAYDGTTNLNLLSGTNTLTPGSSCTVTVTLTVTADPDDGTTIAVNTNYDNTASASSAEGASANSTASTSFPETPAVALTKAVSAGPTNNADGTYTLSYTMTATNTGDVYLDNVVIDDDMTATFGSDLVSTSTTSNSCAAANLAPSVPAGTGDTCALVIEVVVRPGSDDVNLTDYRNDAVVTADSPSNVEVTATDFAEQQFTEAPSVGLVKAISAGPVNNADGTYSLTYTMTATNTGDVNLTNVVIADDMTATFGTDLVSSTATTDSCPTATLAPSVPAGTGDTCVLIINVVVRPGVDDVNITTYRNDAVVTGDSGSGIEVTASDFAEQLFTEAPSVGLVKAISAGPVNNADGTYSLTYTMTATNTGDVNLTNVVIADDMTATFGTDLVSSTATTDSCPAATLAPSVPAGTGDTCVLVIDVVVRPGIDDVNITTYRNDAVVTGDSPVGTEVTASDFAEQLFTEAPSVGLVKAISAGPVNNADGTYSLTYTMTATNTGDVNLTNVVMADDMTATFGTDLVSSTATTDSCPAATLAPSVPAGTGDTCVLVIDVVVRPGIDDVNITTYRNDAVVTGDSPVGTEVTASDFAEQLFTEAPSVGLVKAITAGPVNNADGTYSLTYTMTATNTGDVNLTNVVIADDLGLTFGTDLVSSTSTSDTCPTATLAPSVPVPGAGDTCELVVSVVVRPGADDINVTDYVNDAVVTGDSPVGTEVTETDDETTTFTEAPSVGLVKAITAGPVNNLDGTYSLTYTMVATNTGDVNLGNVVIADDLALTFGTDLVSSTATSDTCPAAILAPSDPAGTGDTCELVLDVVVNPGVDDVNVTTFTNDAVVTADSPTGFEVTATDDAATIFTEAPAVSLTKAITAGPVNNLDGTYSLTYTMVATNTGDVNLYNVVIDDDLGLTFGADLVSSTATSNTCPAAILAPSDPAGTGDTCELVLDVVVNPGDDDVNVTTFTNDAVVDADAGSGAALTDTADASTLFAEAPSVDLVKAITAGPVNNEDGTYSLTYTMVATNTGDVNLYNVVISDDLSATFGGLLTSSTTVADTCPAAVLAPSDPIGAGDSCRLELDVIVTPGTSLDPVTFTNDAVVDAASGSGVPVDATDDATTSFSEAPAIDLVKAITSAPVNNQDGTYSLTYTMVATNTGDVNLTNVVIADDLALTFGPTLTSSTVVSDTCPAATLTPSDPIGFGDSCELELDVVVTPGAMLDPVTFTNDAVVTADSPSGAEATDTDDATTSFSEAPAIDLTKNITTGPINNEDGTYSLTYTMVATNTGDVDLDSVVIDDDLSATFGATLTSSTATTDTCPGLTLEPSIPSGTGDTCSLVLDVVITPGASIDPVTFTNDAVVNADSPSGANATDTDDAVTSFPEMPSIDVVKTVLVQPTSNLDGTFDMTYQIVVENTGDIVLNGVQVTDDLAATFATAVAWTFNSADAALLDPCSINPNFSVGGDTNLLTGTDSMVVDATCTITIDVTIEPGLALGPHNNAVDASGTSPSSAYVDEQSDVDVTVVENPVIDIVKTIVSGPTNDGTGVYTTVYSLVTTNTGDVPLLGVQITDDLETPYTGVASWSETAAVTVGACSINAAFDGLVAGDMNLLTGTDGLAVNESCTVEITVTFDPEGELGTYTNVAGTSGTSPGGEGATDSDGTDSAAVENPEISLTKTIADPPGIVNNEDGTYDLTYSMTVTNTGDVPLNAVQIEDDLTVTFAAATSFTVAPGAVFITAGPCDANPTYDGVTGGDINLLDGDDRLVVNASCTATFVVTVTPGTTLGVYENSATADGESPAGEGVSDISNDGVDADPEDDGPGDNSVPTPATFPENPEISLTKDILDPPAVVNNEDGTYSLSYRMVATNTGDVPLLNAQIADDLSVTYATATAWSVVGTSQPNIDVCTLGTFDGSPDTTLLSGSDTMAVGDVCTVDIEMLITPGADLGPYNNNATATGTSTGGAPVSDISEDGTDPDPDGTGGPGNNSTPTPAWFTEAPQISLNKTITAGPTNNGDGTYSVTYELGVANSGNIELRNVQVDDDMSTTYGSAISWMVDGSSVTQGLCTAATTVAYDGSPAVGLLEGIDTMAVGDTCTIEIDVTFEPGSFLGSYDNSATANGTSPAGDPVTDISQDGDNADPEGDGPSDNSDPTILSVTETPSIDLTKTTVAGPTNNMDGTYTLTWGLTLENTGDIEVRNAQITDDIETTLASAISWTLDSHAVTSGPCTDSATFDGVGSTGDIGLLAGNDTMAIGDICELDVTVTVTPGPVLGVYTNIADASAVSPAGTPLNDTDPEDTTFTEMPLVDIAKNIVSGPVNDGTGIFTSVYELVITNTGDVPLSGVQVTDDLTGVYAGVVSWTATSQVTGGICTDNPTAFDGDGNPNVLSGTDSLPVIFGCTMEITVVFNPGADLGDYVNTATVVGTSPALTPVDDADDASGMAEENPEISLTKDIVDGPVNNNDGTYSLTYALVVTNAGDVPLNGVQVDDSLATTFATATAWQVDGVSVTAGACTAATTVAYDGDAAVGTLEGADTMAVADTCTIEIDVTVTPGADLGPYDNTATATGTSPAGEGVSDISQDGADADPEGDGPGDNSDPTPVWFTEEPQISLTKTIATAPVNNEDGTYTLSYGLVVANTGNVSLADAQVNDDLTVTFADATSFVVTPGSVAVTSGDCTPNSTYDGGLDTRLLAGADTMAITDTCALTFEVTVTPGSVLGVYDNTATANGISPAGEDVSDLSQDGVDADPDGDNDPTNDSVPTPVEFPENPEISLTKDIVDGPSNNQDGTYTLTYGLVATNTGDVALSGVQVDDDLSTTFASASAWTVDGVSVTAGDCTTATTVAYDGATAIGTLEGTDTMNVNDSCTIEVIVTVTPGATLGVYDNTATAGGTSPGGSDVTDISQDGADADPDGDGDPTNDSVPTPASFSENPEISLTKDIVAGPENRGNGTYDMTYGLVVTNTGDDPLAGVQVDDDLATRFAAAADWAFNGVAVTAGTCTASTTYDGRTVLGALAGTDGLAVGESCSIEIDVEITPGAELGPYNNTATAEGSSPAGTDVTDISQDGTEADPDGDGDPSNNSDPTPAWFTEEPAIALAKDLIDGPTTNGDGTYDLTYAMVVSNTGNVPVLGVQVNDTLNVAFADAESFEMKDLTIASGVCTASSTYDGVDDTGLLSGDDVLTTSDTCTIEITVVVAPGEELGPYNNSATVLGASASGGVVTDVSQDGPDQDPDNDNDAGNNSEPTPAEFPIDPSVALTKRVQDGPTLISGSNYDLTYRLVVANTGDTALRNTQVDDNLATTFATAQAWTVAGVTVTDGDCTASTTFNGNSDVGMLAGTDTLAIAASCTIDVNVTVDVGTTDANFDNTATATGVDPNGDPVTDISQDGVDADPDGDGDATDDNVPTSVLVTGVAPPPAPVVPAPIPPTLAFVEPPAPLAITGANSLRLASLAVALLAFGATMVLGARRRQEEA